MKVKLIVLFVSGLLGSMANYATASIQYFQGFESNTNGWFDQSNGWTGELNRVASGHGGILSRSGGFHATARQTTTSGIGLSGPFSDFDGNGLGSALSFPGRITVTTDIYLSTNWSLGSGFDYSTAINQSNGSHQQDFIFHVTKDSSTGKLFVGGSNNTSFDPREDLETVNHFEVVSDGWYRFEHVFRDQAGVLFGDMILRDHLGVELFRETRTGGDPTATTGGARYSWFTNIDIDDGIAIDNHHLNEVPEPGSYLVWTLVFAIFIFVSARRRKAIGRLTVSP